jgi:hypothetical protein
MTFIRKLFQKWKCGVLPVTKPPDEAGYVDRG